MLPKFKKDIFMDDFVCERLKSNDQNKSLLRGFSCSKNPSLAYYLKMNAWREDFQNYRSFYLLKERMKIVLYFSLQCGMLVKCHRKQLGGIKHRNINKDVEYYVDSDKIEVTKVIPAIELAHFCVNDSYRKQKKSWSIPHGIRTYSVGVYAFYSYIAPLILQLANIAGAQYVYLFCADDGSEKLQRFYSEQLHFELMDDMACIRPDYDDTLDCMTLKISELEKHTDRFNDMNSSAAILEYLKENTTLSIYQAKKIFSISDPIFLFSSLVEAKLVEISSVNENGEIVRVKYIN